MFRALFARLTGRPKRGQDLFELAVREARRPEWFVQGDVPDTVNGRFAVLATVIALITIRLEREGAKEASAALTERLVESLDAEIREMGVGDPSLGKQVRKLVGAVAGRVERWRALAATDGDWTEEVLRSLYLDEPVSPDAVAYSDSELRQLWKHLGDSDLGQLY
jgi:cytochrome b pre-mRNA-processing protein 3